MAALSKLNSLPHATPSSIDAYHLSIDPGLGFVYGSDIPGAVAKVGISAAGFTGVDTAMTISGSTTTVTSLAFSGGSAFYTNAGVGGLGQFGTAVIGASTITTTMTQTLLAAHGMVLDPFTGWLTLFGDRDVAQIEPASPGVTVATLTLAGVDFDQGTSDGLGHLWVASNNGNVTFIDLTSCTGGKVDALSCFIDTRFLISNLDDLAPLAGLGSCEPNSRCFGGRQSCSRSTSRVCPPSRTGASTAPRRR